MSLMLAEGDHFEMKGRRIRVSRVQADVGPRVRGVLIEVAKRGELITYGDLRAPVSATVATVSSISRVPALKGTTWP